MKKIRDTALDSFSRQFKGSLIPASEIKNMEFLRTGVPGLDEFLLYGKGIPKSRITEIHGPYSSGKSTLAFKIIAQTQKDYPGESVFFVDSEGRFNADWAELCGVDLDRLQMVEFKFGEDMLDKVTNLVSFGAVLVVVDSVAGIIPKSLGNLDSLEDVSADKNFARSRLLTTFCDRIAGGYSVSGGSKMAKYTRLVHSPTALVFVNHWKDKPKMSSWGPTPDGSVGGQSLRYHSSLRISFARRSSKKEDRGMVSIAVRKSIICPPGRRADFFIEFGTGVVKSTPDWMVALFVKSGIFEKSGRKYQIVKGTKALVGMEGKPEDLLDYLTARPTRMNALLALVPLVQDEATPDDAEGYAE